MENSNNVNTQLCADETETIKKKLCSFATLLPTELCDMFKVLEIIL